MFKITPKGRRKTKFSSPEAAADDPIYTRGFAIGEMRSTSSSQNTTGTTSPQSNVKQPTKRGKMAKRISGTSWTEEDYKKQSCYEVGTFHRASPSPQTSKTPSTNLPDEDQIRLHNLNEQWLKEQFPQSESTAENKPGKS